RVSTRTGIRAADTAATIRFIANAGNINANRKASRLSLRPKEWATARSFAAVTALTTTVASATAKAARKIFLLMESCAVKSFDLIVEVVTDWHSLYLTACMLNAAPSRMFPSVNHWHCFLGEKGVSFIPTAAFSSA